MFNTQANANYDGLSIPSLEPGKYTNGRLIEVKTELTTKQDGSNGKRIISFTFKSADGKLHQHSEWDPTEGSTPEKIKNMTKRIGHIMSKFVPAERLGQENTTFEGYANWVVGTMNSVQYREVPIDFLIVGNVYNNKATTQLMGYPPFIAKSGDKLEFDNNAITANKQYEAFMARQQNARPDADGAAPQNSFGTSSGETVQPDF